MKAWYSKVRDTELIDGSVRADYVVTFETDNAELKREVEKYLQGIMDKDEPQNYCDDCLYTDTCDDKAFFYACTSKATISKMEQVDKDINVRSKDEPQTYVINPQEPTNDDKCFECDDFFICDGQCDEVEDEPQTDAYDSARFSHNCIGICENPMTYIAKVEDEPQTERSE